MMTHIHENSNSDTSLTRAIGILQKEEAFNGNKAAKFASLICYGLK